MVNATDRSLSRPQPNLKNMIHAMTVDVEDTYNLAMRQRMGIDLPPTEAVVRATNAMLGLLAEHQVKATFFALGEVATTFPQLIKNIAGAGHEIGVHGFYHHLQALAH